MTDDDAFRKAIDDQPNDASLKLIYADWLEERGDPRAEEVRHQAKEPVAVPPVRGRHQLYAWAPTLFFIANEAAIFALDRPERVADESGGRLAHCWAHAEVFAIFCGVLGILIGFGEVERQERWYYRVAVFLRAEVASILVGAVFGCVAGWLGWGFYLCAVWYYLWRGC